jgi:hypothetical protein
MLDLRFFQNARFSAASGAITLVFFSMLGVMFIFTQHLQRHHPARWVGPSAWPSLDRWCRRRIGQWSIAAAI